MVQILPAGYCYQALFNTAIVVWELIVFWCSPRIYCLERVRKTRAKPNYLNVCTMVQKLDGMWTTNMLIEFYILQDVTTSSAFAFLVTSTADISQNQIPIPITPSHTKCFIPWNKFNIPNTKHQVRQPKHQLLPNIDLCCFVARQFLSWICAFFVSLFTGLKQYQIWQISCMDTVCWKEIKVCQKVENNFPQTSIRHIISY